MDYFLVPPLPFAEIQTPAANAPSASAKGVLTFGSTSDIDHPHFESEKIILRNMRKNNKAGLKFRQEFGQDVELSS